MWGRAVLPVLLLWFCACAGADGDADAAQPAALSDGASAAGPGKRPLNLEEVHARADTDGNEHLSPKELVALLHHAWHSAAQAMLHLLPAETQAFFLRPSATPAASFHFGCVTPRRLNRVTY